jgi:hypothetical protein
LRRAADTRARPGADSVLHTGRPQGGDRSLYCGPDEGQSLGSPARVECGLLGEHRAGRHQDGLRQQGAEDRLPSQLLRCDKIVEVETLWTTTGYWLFNADDYLKYSSTEKWDPIPANKRDTRGTLVAAANAYLDAFLEKKIDQVPWGFPCVRIEGGAYTGKGKPDDSCEVGVPAGVNIANRRFIVDEELGTVAVYCTFGAGGGPNGGSGAPDTHLFRVENGKLRYVHTLTHLLQSAFRGNSNNTGTNRDAPR